MPPRRGESHEDSQKKTHRHVYDLGLLPREVRTLRKQAGVVYHAFNFSAEPAHFAMDRNAGAYAWKPVLIKEMLDKHAAEVLWLDCGDRIVRPTALPKIFNVIRALGFVSESSVRTTQRWVHPGMLTYLGAEGLDVTNCNGALVGAARFHRHYADIVEPWVRCARVEACIAPPGSNRRNHRQDQAALTVLAHQAGVACRRMHLSVHYHHDDPSDEGTLDGRPKSRRPAGG